MSTHRVNIIRAFREAFAEEMARDASVILVGEDVWVGGVFGTSRGLYEKFGSTRVRNTPISEGAVVGMAVGAAMTGMRPIVDLMYMTFGYMAMDSIVNQAAKFRYMTGGQVKVPLVLVGVSGGGHAGAAQHSENPYHMFMGVPGLKVVVPSDPYTGKGLLKSAVRDDNPVLVFHEANLNRVRQDIPDDEYVYPIGKARTVLPGADVTVATVGHVLQHGLEAAHRAKETHGISVEVVDVLSLNPLDVDTLAASVRKTGRLLVADDTPELGGAAGQIVAAVTPRVWGDLKASPVSIGRRFAPIAFNRTLESLSVVNSQRLYDSIVRIVLEDE
ncbi:MAG: alpha-ketoacid dehydrogenase subunit beta [Alicyclobacillus macrosporangiidus]|uniref:alpha-ketoacid dehydrogenase subunit beta n=1 Tax=Alicyclobacillus macrosporangiidus TaxID=392015 RepID=UPI0026ED95AD|nr:transketolase C-terminal domain-containing protein [Alicyclobacillus macrosporangiidus]MCL6597608.1 alpha-ketoacid dehydrogenase subunit beta [Alicyclobacillus macrosporangiidus]